MNSKDDLADWLHDHVFDEGSETAERSTRLVMWITAMNNRMPTVRMVTMI